MIKYLPIKLVNKICIIKPDMVRDPDNVKFFLSRKDIIPVLTNPLNVIILRKNTETITKSISRFIHIY